MHYLGLALYAEGRTDERFLSPILRRLCEDVCSRESRHLVEINDEIVVLAHSAKSQAAFREERVLDAAIQARGAWSILFVHADADGDVAKARRERAQPALDRVRQEFGPGHGEAVAVIPIQETESWALCDGDAVRRVFGTTLDDTALGLPASASSVERIANPKRCLDAAFKASRAGGRRGRSRNVNETLSALGEQVKLTCLRRLTAFQTLENELRQALQVVRVLD